MSRPRGTYDEVERFAQDVDLLLADQPVAETSDDDYQADLALAHLLSQGGFEPDPHFKCRLRNQLLNQLCEERKELKTMSPMKVFRSLARPVLVASLSAVILLGAVLAISPDARAAAQEMWVRFVEVDSPQDVRHPDEKTSDDRDRRGATPTLPSREKAEKPSDGRPQPPSEGGPEKSMTLPPAPDALPTRELISLEDAQAKVSFTIRMPTTLPEGYRFLGVVPAPELPTDAPLIDADAPKVEPPQMVFLVFGNSAGDTLALSEALIPNPAAIEVPLPAGEGSVQEVTVNGQSAQYVEGTWTEEGWVSSGRYQLHWQDAEGVMYDLSSLTLDLKVLLPVAESIK